MAITISDIVSASAVMLVGAGLQASAGFGMGLVAVPLLALINLAFVPGPLIFATLFLHVAVLARGRLDIDFANTNKLVVGLLAGTVVGTCVISFLQINALAVILGILILVSVALSVIGLTVRPNAQNLVVAGAVSGFMGTVAAIGGPPVALFYQYEHGNKIRATLAYVFLVGSVMAISGLIIAGRFGLREVHLGLMLLPGILLGYTLSILTTRFLDKGHMRTAVLAISSLSGLALIVRYLSV